MTCEGFSEHAFAVPGTVSGRGADVAYTLIDRGMDGTYRDRVIDLAVALGFAVDREWAAVGPTAHSETWNDLVIEAGMRWKGGDSHDHLLLCMEVIRMM